MHLNACNSSLHAWSCTVAKLATAMTVCVYVYVCVVIGIFLRNTLFDGACIRKALKKQRLGEWLRTRGQSSKGSAAWHPEWLPAREPRRPFHLPAATSGRSNDRVNMHTVLASCSISHYDPIFWINSLRMPAIFWNKTTHHFHIPYTYIRFPNEDNLWISPDQRAIAKNKLAIKTFTVWLMPLLRSRTSSKRSVFKIKNQNLANVFSPPSDSCLCMIMLIGFQEIRLPPWHEA